MAHRYLLVRARALQYYHAVHSLNHFHVQPIPHANPEFIAQMAPRTFSEFVQSYGAREQSGQDGITQPAQWSSPKSALEVKMIDSTDNSQDYGESEDGSKTSKQDPSNTSPAHFDAPSSPPQIINNTPPVHIAKIQEEASINNAIPLDISGSNHHQLAAQLQTEENDHDNDSTLRNFSTQHQAEDEQMKDEINQLYGGVLDEYLETIFTTCTDLSSSSTGAAVVATRDADLFARRLATMPYHRRCLRAVVPWAWVQLQY